MRRCKLCHEALPPTDGRLRSRYHWGCARRRAVLRRRVQAARLEPRRAPMARDGQAPTRLPWRVWAAVTSAVRDRARYRCQWCGRPERENVGRDGKARRLSVDHVRPLRTEGEPTALDGYAALCLVCHGRKTAGAEQRALRGDVLDQRRYERTVGAP